ncbi:cation-translocating P-type ATPase [Ideonella sp. DXS22W]|uniref:Cation-translocating P-type ATPase n=1 Tax=Pseudaquabacterium inlustre TaxID=2984192 RepID=A0ABU9CN08_9BURK
MPEPFSGPATDPAGLCTDEAVRRLATQGPNELPAPPRRGAAGLLREVLLEPMFLLLAACGAIYLALGDRHEALMLLGFVAVVVGITVVQKRRSERSLEVLRELSSPRALVLRDGRPQRVAARELVTGDLVLLAEGDRVPADLRLRAASNLAIDESLLTGESLPVAKPVAGATAPVLAFAGTLVTQGSGQGEVCATGPRSALGRIGASLRAQPAEPTPVQRETQRIVTWVAAGGLALAAALAGAWGLTRGDWLHGLLAGLTLAMAILPEELPVVLTIFLGLGAWRLAREQVLARRMPAVELLGATTVLCVDKTGTLTRNHMAVRQLWADGAARPQAADGPPGLPEAVHALLEYAVLASHRRAFDPMEQAIGEAGQHHLARTEHLHADWTLVDDYALSPQLLAMSRVWRSPDRQDLLVAAKGAPEAIVDLCHLPDAQRAHIAAQVARLAAEGLRVLGVARAIARAGALPPGQHDFDFAFVGLVGLADPLRPEVPAAIAECRAAGIRVVMITGDHPHTALAIARQAGLDGGAPPLTGPELDRLDDAALAARLADTCVFCRVQPEQKLRLVQAFRARGDTVAMTGDGVNDAPALQAAHIGVAMGARGTDVAREAAALVLLADDFGALLTAVRHGRRVFANLRKAIAFVLAVHVPIVGLSVVPLLLGWPMVLMPVHILSLQLIIDPACAIVFEAEPLEPAAMRAPPRPAEARLFDAALLWRGGVQGAGLLGLVLLAYLHGRTATGQDEVARALAFTVLVLGNLALIQANRRWAPGGGAGQPWNRAFGWISAGTALLLAVVLCVPAVGRLFAFSTPPWPLLLAGAGYALAALGWFAISGRWAARRALRPAPRPAIPPSA